MDLKSILGSIKPKTLLIALGSTLGVVLIVVVAMLLFRVNDDVTDVLSEIDPLENIALDDEELDSEEEIQDEEEYEDEPAEQTPRAILTGLPIYEESNQRPLAFVINNIRRALPQSGIASADIIYEVLAEGDVTRLVAIFQSYIPDMIGPIRSTRDYFVDFAFNHDAIFIHHGGSISGYARVRNTGIDSLDGMNLEGSVFWRDRTYPDWHWNSGVRPLEHSSYAGWQNTSGNSNIKSHIESNSIRNYINDDPAFVFSFGEVPEGIASTFTANEIRVPFSNGYVRTFIFDEENGVYLVENRDGEHDDATTREQVAVGNILIQLTSIRVIDNEGRREVGTVGSGSGFLIREGEVFNVTWAKSSISSPMSWYFESGDNIVLTPGRTWINVFQETGEVVFE